MTSPRTLKTLAVLITAYALCVVPAYWGPSYLESTSSYFVIVPFLSIYLFHSLGIPGLLTQGGHCGWGWCSPTVFGWMFLVTAWVAIAWLLAGALTWVTRELHHRPLH